jgi:pimeloyl-ACP methyl ester carboxylesterase
VERPLPEVSGVEHRFVNAGGLRTHVAEAGSGPPLVMLHGWPQNWWMWRELIGPLAESHRVICPDLRGFGWTAAPPGGYDPEIFAMDIIALLDAMEIGEPIDLVGHDWGGWTGFILCLRNPRRVRRYLALNIFHPFTRAGPRGLLNLWRFWYQWVLGAPGIGTRVSRSLPVLHWLGSRRVNWDPQERTVYLDQLREPERALATSLLYRHSAFELMPAAARGVYRKLTMETPALLLFGVDDHVQNHRMLPGFERNAPNMRLELVRDCGHFIVDERPELVLTRAWELFGQHRPSRV